MALRFFRLRIRFDSDVGVDIRSARLNDPEDEGHGEEEGRVSPTKALDTFADTELGKLLSWGSCHDDEEGSNG